MYKQLLTGSFLITLLFAVGLPARAQTTTEQAPASQEPASQEPAAPQKEVSSEELQRFANAVKQILTIEQDYQGRMAQAVENTGLSAERYIEIRKSQDSSTAQPSAEMSQEEKQNYEQANAQVTQLVQEADSKKKEAVQAQGLDLQRFNEIFAAIQQDPSLQQQVQQMIQN